MTKRAKTYTDPFSFPDPITIDLEDYQRDGMLEIANRVPHENDEELLKWVLSRGIVAVLADDPQQGPITAEDIARKIETLRERKERFFDLQPDAEPGLSARAVRVFPSPSVLYKKRQQENQAINNLGEDVGLAQSEDGEAFEATPHRHVETYVGFPISERTRRMLEDFLDAHAGVSEEDALAQLLGAGLDQAEREADVRAPSKAAKKATRMTRLAERLYRLAKQRCG